MRIRIRLFMMVLWLFLSAGCLFGQIGDTEIPPGQLPVHLNVSLDLYKIYDINTVTETFKIDGYFSYEWDDVRMAFDSTEVGLNEVIYFGERFDDLIKERLWFPELIFINTLEKRSIENSAVIIKDDGHIKYVERFHATMKEELEYHRFPFDEQDLVVEIEPFIYDSRYVIIDSLLFKDAVANDSIESDHWDISDRYTQRKFIPESEQFNQSEANIESKEYSRAEAVIVVKRRPGFYIWQVIFPLGIIIISSIVIFWIESFQTQISIGFTLLLTMVAFNFFSETMLPKLSYNTFVEMLIILGYVFMLFSIFFVVYLKRIKSSHPTRAEKFTVHGRIFYPILIVTVYSLVSLLYFDTQLF